MTRRPRPQPAPLHIQEIFQARVRTLPAPPYYRIAARRFLAFLQTNFPAVLQLSDLHRDPHLLGWVRSLSEQDPPLSNTSRRIYLLALRRLLRELAAEGHPVAPGLILPEDFPPRPGALKKDRPSKLPRRPPAPRLPHPVFAEIFEARIHTLAITLRTETVQNYRTAARRFLDYLQTDFPHLASLSDLCRDPHLLGWFQKLHDEHPPLSAGTRQLYLLKLRRLFYDANSDGPSLQPGLIVSADIPAARPPRPKQDRPTPTPLLFQNLFEIPLQHVATTVQPGTTQNYRRALRHFLSFLQTKFPQLLEIAELRRDPHLLAWLRALCQQRPPLSARTRQQYLFDIRRLLTELTVLGYSVPPDLILREDFPPLPHYLPRALSPEDDQRLQQELRRTDDLACNALLLTRATGMRIGECINLAANCLRSLGPNQWALHVPLGKLYTERFVPADEDIRQIVSRLRNLRDCPPAVPGDPSAHWLLPRPANYKAFYFKLRMSLRLAAQRAGCSAKVTCHQLRHTFATEMLRLGVSLPALMLLLGHKDIRMTMRYVQVTQQDLQREFHRARQAAPQHHLVPKLPLADPFSLTPDLAGVQRALRATRHLLDMYRRQLSDDKTRRKLQRLDRRLLDIASQVELMATVEK